MKTEIRKLLGSEKLIIGTDRVLKSVKKGEAAKVILASNAPAELKTELLRYQTIAKTFEIESSDLTNDELGTLCKKPFSIAAIAVRA